MLFITKVKKFIFVFGKLIGAYIIYKTGGSDKDRCM